MIRSVPTLRDTVNVLDELDDDAIIYTDGGSGAAEAAVVTGAEAAQAKAAGLRYFLEVSLAKDAVAVCSEWRNGAEPTVDDKIAAVAYYATHDAYLPVD
jgi:hypothetical protein